MEAIDSFCRTTQCHIVQMTVIPIFTAMRKSTWKRWYHCRGGGGVWRSGESRRLAYRIKQIEVISMIAPEYPAPKNNFSQNKLIWILIFGLLSPFAILFFIFLRTWFIWIRIGTSGPLLWPLKLNVMPCNILGNSREVQVRTHFSRTHIRGVS